MTIQDLNYRVRPLELEFLIQNVVILIPLINITVLLILDHALCCLLLVSVKSRITLHKNTLTRFITTIFYQRFQCFDWIEIGSIVLLRPKTRSRFDLKKRGVDYARVLFKKKIYARVCDINHLYLFWFFSFGFKKIVKLLCVFVDR